MFTSTVQDAVCEHLKEALMHMNEVEYNYAVQLLVAVLCKAKVELLVTSSVLEKAHMIYINEENLPTTYIPIHKICLESTIQSLVKTRPVTDSRVAMGFMFERAVGFKFIDGLIVKAKLSTADAKDAPYEFEIPRMSSPTNQYKSEENTPLGNNQLWLTPTNFCSFDYIGICEVPEIGKVLLAVSCTLQKEGNSSKVSSMVLMPLLRELALTQCNGNVIVLYINPEMTNSFDNLFLSFRLFLHSLLVTTLEVNYATILHYQGIAQNFVRLSIEFESYWLRRLFSSDHTSTISSQ